MQLCFQNHNVLFYTTVYCMYNNFTAYLDRSFFIVNSLDAEDGESNKVISAGPILASVSSSAVFFHQGKSRRSRCSRFVLPYCYLWRLSIASNSVILWSPLARPLDSLQQICGGRNLVRPFQRMYDWYETYCMYHVHT